MIVSTKCRVILRVKGSIHVTCSRSEAYGGIGKIFENLALVLGHYPIIACIWSFALRPSFKNR